MPSVAPPAIVDNRFAYALKHALPVSMDAALHLLELTMIAVRLPRQWVKALTRPYPTRGQ